MTIDLTADEMEAIVDALRERRDQKIDGMDGNVPVHSPSEKDITDFIDDCRELVRRDELLRKIEGKLEITERINFQT